MFPRTAFCIPALPCAVALCSTLVLPAAAQQTSQPQQVIANRIVTGDTLTQIAQRYLGDATLWQALQSHNKVGSPYRLQPGSMLEVPMWLMRKATASVDFVQGSAQLRNRSTAAPQPPCLCSLACRSRKVTSCSSRPMHSSPSSWQTAA